MEPHGVGARVALLLLMAVAAVRASRVMAPSAAVAADWAASNTTAHRHLLSGPGRSGVYQWKGTYQSPSARLGVKSVAYRVDYDADGSVKAVAKATCGNGRKCPYYDTKNRLRYCCKADDVADPEATAEGTCGFGAEFCDTCPGSSLDRDAQTCLGEHGTCFQYFPDNDISATPETCSPGKESALSVFTGDVDNTSPDNIPSYRFCCYSGSCSLCHDVSTSQVLLRLKKQNARNRKRLAQWGVGNYCNWPGIVCSYGEVVMIDLYGFRLYGSLPNWGSMQYQKTLNSLVYLDLSYNYFDGDLRADYHRLDELMVLYLDNNKLEGSLPYEWMAMTDLQVLSAWNNFLDGVLPDSWGRFSATSGMPLAELYVRPGNPDLDACLPQPWAVSCEGTTPDMTVCWTVIVPEEEQNTDNEPQLSTLCNADCLSATTTTCTDTAKVFSSTARCSGQLSSTCNEAACCEVFALCSATTTINTCGTGTWTGANTCPGSHPFSCDEAECCVT